MVIRMPNIKEASALHNYAEVLDEVVPGAPVFLSRDGSSRYVILDMSDYNSMKDALWDKLFAELDVARESGSVPIDEAKQKILGHG